MLSIVDELRILRIWTFVANDIFSLFYVQKCWLKVHHFLYSYVVHLLNKRCAAMIIWKKYVITLSTIITIAQELEKIAFWCFFLFLVYFR